MKTIQQNLAFNFIPDNNKIQELQLQFDAHDVVYNMCLEYTIKEYQKTNVLRYSIQEWQNYCAHIFQANNPFYGYVSYADALVVYGALLDLEQDLKLFLNKLIPYPPTPKRFDNPYRSFNLYYANQTDKFLPAPTTITIPIIGTIDLSKSIKSEQLSRLLYITIGRENNNYYIMICIEQLLDAIYTYQIPKWIGLYMDKYTHSVALSYNTTNIQNFKLPYYVLNKIEKLQEIAPTENASFDKRKKLLDHAVLEWYDSIAQYLIDAYDVIVIENPPREFYTRFNKFKIAIPSFIHLSSKLLELTKLQNETKQLIRVRNASENLQKCSKCDTRYPNDLNHSSQWYCPVCRTLHDTFINAAQNVLKQGVVKYNQMVN